MKSIVLNQPPVSFEADREHDQSQNGCIEPRSSGGGGVNHLGETNTSVVQLCFPRLTCETIPFQCN